MAKIAPINERRKAQIEVQRGLVQKNKEHEKLGKPPFQYDPYGPGIMPEEEWQKYKQGGELPRG